MKNKKWKTLDLNSLKENTKQVVIGFKINPQIKLRLASEALSRGTNIGNYVRHIIKNRELIETAHQLKLEVSELKKTISKYETPEAKEKLVNYKGESVEYTENGVKKSRVINNIEDLYFVIVKLVKPKTNGI